MTTDYTVRLERLFQGPMDLLLHLVREQEVEIHEVEISKVIEGYLHYLEALREMDIEVASEFLVIAATLMSIKSRSLLPREEVDLDEELDPKDELIQRLLEYRRFREVSDGLDDRQRERERLFERGSHPELREAKKGEERTLDIGELTAWDLLGAFSRLMRETLANRPHQIAGDPRPLRFYVRSLAATVRGAGQISLRGLMESIDPEPTKETMVGAFCALLELIKLGVVTAVQPERADEISVCITEEAIEDVDSMLDAVTFEDEVEEEDESSPTEDASDTDTATADAAQ
jgi:segregation and condensation protein A